ncbi:GFA family protein [Novosphingobium tardum]|uniref:GFA family protein n=1 Tax=Novosphingobium tardum TaxID=1538021 RepID=A0ABV8RUB4_9SPHN
MAFQSPTSTVIRQAQCHCGGLQLECIGEPTKVSLCHCLDCQRRTGSLFSVAAFYPRDAVRIVSDEAGSFRRPSGSGKDVTFHFCRACGSNLWWEAERLPALIGVAVGAFADPGFPLPEQQVWAESRHPWLLLTDLPTHAKNPTPPTMR